MTALLEQMNEQQAQAAQAKALADQQQAQDLERQQAQALQLYREILQRADNPSAGDSLILQDVMQTLSITSNDVQNDLAAMAEGQRLVTDLEEARKMPPVPIEVTSLRTIEPGDKPAKSIEDRNDELPRMAHNAVATLDKIRRERPRIASMLPAPPTVPEAVPFITESPLLNFLAAVVATLGGAEGATRYLLSRGWRRSSSQLGWWFRADAPGEIASMRDALALCTPADLAGVIATGANGTALDGAAVVEILRKRLAL